MRWTRACATENPNPRLHALLDAGARPRRDGGLLVPGVPVPLLGGEPGVAVHVVRDALPPGATGPAPAKRRLPGGSERGDQLGEVELVLFERPHEAAARALASHGIPSSRSAPPSSVG